VLILKFQKYFASCKGISLIHTVSILLSYGADAVARGGGCDSDVDNNGTQN
jgi:hypothetical protein